MNGILAVVSLSHFNLKAIDGQAQKVQVVFGPGSTFMASNEGPYTIIPIATGKSVLVMETEDEIKELLKVALNKKGKK